MTQSPFRICLIMHATRSYNMGVGALSIAEVEIIRDIARDLNLDCLLYTSPSPRDRQKSRMPSSA